MARKRRGAGFDEDAVRRRDNAELIGYIPQLESEPEKKFDEAEQKFLAAKSLEACESNRTHHTSQRSHREDQLRRSPTSFQLGNASKEKEINLLRKSLDDTQKKLLEKEQSLLKEQVLLDQREENILSRLESVIRSEKRLEEEKLNLKDERKVLLEEKNKLDLSKQAIISREEAIIQKQSILDKRESELLVLQKAIASKERAEIERLREEQEVALERRRQEFDTKMDIKLASFEEEIDVRKTLLDKRETAINEQQDALAQREQNLNIRLVELANKEESLVKKSDELREEEKRLSCGKSKNGRVENLKQNCVHMSPDEDKNAGPKHSIVKKLELSPVSAPIFWVRKCAQVIFKRSLKKSAAYSDGHQLENGAGKVTQTEDGLKVGKKRSNNVLSHGECEILQPKRKQQRSTTQTFRVTGGEIDSNCPSVLEEKCSKNEHDAVPVGLCGKGPHNPQEGELASSDDVLLVNGKSDASDVPEGDEHSEDISVSAAEPSDGHCIVDSKDKDEPDEDSDDEGDKEGKTPSAKIWRFLIT